MKNSRWIVLVCKWRSQKGFKQRILTEKAHYNWPCTNQLGKKLLKKTSWLNEEVNRTGPSPSVSVPWLYAIDTAMLPATGVQFVAHFVAKSPQVRRQRRLENHRKKLKKKTGKLCSLQRRLKLQYCKIVSVPATHQARARISDPKRQLLVTKLVVLCFTSIFFKTLRL